MVYKRLKNMREDRDLTQQQIADYLRVSRSAYKNYENGERGIPIEVFSSLADFYKTTVDYLIGRTNDPNPPKR